MFLYFELHQFKQLSKFYELLIFQDVERIALALCMQKGRNDRENGSRDRGKGNDKGRVASGRGLEGKEKGLMQGRETGKCGREERR